ncbi:hypothetical protein DIPPA_20071 [Diplonema papillatum]|nr:hypothetical protein DIPPA_20071 [Diplonema papillatum]|eukprot:gene2221-3424_t
MRSRDSSRERQQSSSSERRNSIPRTSSPHRRKAAAEAETSRGVGSTGWRYVQILVLAYLSGVFLANLLVSREVVTDNLAALCNEKQSGGYKKHRQVGLPSASDPGSLSGIVERAQNGTVIMTFASYKYLSTMVNWLIHVEQHGITNYAVVCLDNELPTWFAKHRAKCAYVLPNWKKSAWSPAMANNCTPDGALPTIDNNLVACKISCEQDPECKAITWNDAARGCYKCFEDSIVRQNEISFIYRKLTTDTLWFARWKLLIRLLGRGVHILMADLDAFFLQDPMPYLQMHEGQDLVSQRGSYPEVQSKKWGAALCMGFTFWRATDNTKRFTSLVNSMMEATGDDQIGVNQALDLAEIEWHNAGGKALMEFETSKTDVTGVTRKGLRVTLLSHQQFPRKCDEYSEHALLTNAVVAHCFEPAKQGEAKMKLAQKFNLWRLRDDWETLDTSHTRTLSEYLYEVRFENTA